MLFHNSHDPRYRDPIGPVAAGGALRLRFDCDEADSVTLRTWDGGERRWPMKKEGEHAFTVAVPVPEQPMLFWYDFIAHRRDGDVRYGTSYDQLGGQGAVYHGQPQSYQVTVYDPAYETPDFLRHGVIYQIFPDRFFRDEKAGKGRAKQIKAAHPDAAFHASWYEPPLLDVDPVTSDNRALDFFGGTLRGIAEKLDDLQELGVTALYLNPVFRARTNHRYDTGSYEEIDPILGDQKAFDHLIKAAGKRGMRVLLDGVFSHTGSDSLYFNRYGRYPTVGAYQSQQSPYYPWYTFYQFPDRYRTWWAFDTLPAVEKGNESYRDYLLNPKDGIVPRWIGRGAAGWRLDVADELPMSLVRGIRQSAKGENPEAALVGEVWEDASNKVSYGKLRSYCLGDTLDSVMNYPLRRAVIDFFTHRCNAAQLCRVILHQREVYPAPFYYSLMNLLGSHDRMRIVNAMAGYDCEGAVPMDRVEASRVCLRDGELEAAREKVLAAYKLLCALPGAPTVYYGDEIGMQGMADPWNRAPMDWKGGDKALRKAVGKLLRERQAKPLLQTGYLDVTADGDDALILRRYAVKGRDVFGQPVTGRAVQVRVERNSQKKA